MPAGTPVYVRVYEEDFPSSGGHALSAGMEDGRFIIGGDEEEWEDASWEDLERDMREMKPD